MEDIRVALAQINCIVGDLERNLETHVQCARRAAKAGARIVCFPESSLTGYPDGDCLPHDLAQPMSGPLCQSMASLSKETRLVLLAGFVERDRSGVVYNTQLITGPTGWIGGYRKTHVGNSEIHRFYHGDDLPVFIYGSLTFGLQICYDNHFPEAARTLALRGAEIIFSPYASPGPNNLEGVAAKRSRWLRYLPARAFDNSVYIVVVNQVGKSRIAKGENATSGGQSTARDTHCDLPEFPGGSMVLNPWGEVIAQTESLVEDLLVLDLSAAVFQDKRRDALQFFTHFRRPELYHELTHPSRIRLQEELQVNIPQAGRRASV
jgi:predicted amidohydrolase